MARAKLPVSGRGLGGFALALVVCSPACQWISGFEDFEAAQGGGGGAAGGGAAGGGATAVGGKGGVSAAGGGAGDEVSAAGTSGSAGAPVGGTAGDGGVSGSAGAGTPPNLGGEGGAGTGGAAAGGAPAGGAPGMGGEAGSAGTAGSAGAAQAPGIHGPSMVAYPDVANVRFWIDATEVTRGQYREFLQALDGSVPPQESYCDWNDSLVPTCGGWSTGGAGGAGGASGAGGEAGSNQDDADLPVACVDWCDARAFCAWASKRLCNEPYIPANEPYQSEWYVVCTSGGSEDYPYPYGSAYERSACRGAELPAAVCPGECWPYSVGDLSSCKTPTEAYDMSGNVAEWVNSCNGTEGVIDSCRVRGGSYTSDQFDLLCEARPERFRDDARADLGFRCCAGPL